MNYYIKVSLDPAKSEMMARACLHLEGETPTEELTLQINPHLQVTRVQSLGCACDFSQSQAGQVTVTLPTGTSGAQHVLEVDYAGRLPQCESAGEQARAFINDDFFWLRDDQYWFPVPVGAQEEELFPIPPGRYVVQMQLPSGWEAAASSPLVRRWNEDLFEYYKWDTQNEYPGISVVGGRLQRHVDGKCAFLWLAPRPDLAEIVLGALDFCEEILGPCLHSGLTVVMGPRFVPGGYADRGLVYVGENKLDTRTLAHELVHQWWGRGVWAKHHGDRWVTEGLAEYLALLYIESKNESSLEEMLETYKEIYLQAVVTWGDKPIVQIDSEDYQKKGLVSALLYKKGAWLHRMLHFLLGGQYFFALQTIYPKYYSRSITTEQYIAELTDICEEHRDALETFARQWLHSPGLPRLQIEVVERRESPDGVEVTMAIQQLQQTYTISVILEIRAGDSCRRRQLWLAEGRTMLTEIVPDDQFSLVIDPDNWVMKKVVDCKLVSEVIPPKAKRPKSANVMWESTSVSREMREQRHGHKAAVLWFTGLSGAGKSTVARLLEQRLFALGCQVMYLDGDNIRHGLCGDLGFSLEDRKENIRRVAEMAKLAFEHGMLVLCAFISPSAADRQRARSLLPDGRFIEIYVKCDLELAMRRDPKGLYLKVRRGDIKSFTGIDEPYEAPQNPEIKLNTMSHAPELHVSEIIGYLRQNRLLS